VNAETRGKSKGSPRASVGDADDLMTLEALYEAFEVSKSVVPKARRRQSSPCREAIPSPRRSIPSSRLEGQTCTGQQYPTPTFRHS